MNNVVWKAFKFDEIFNLDSSFNTKTSNKNLKISKVKDSKHSLLLINKGGTNNAVEGYIERKSHYKTCNKGITMDDQFGNCYYHNTEFIMTGGGHINVLTFKDIKLESIASKNENIYYYLTLILRKIFQKSGIFGYMYKITGKRPNREHILIPVIEVMRGDEYLWEQNNRFYTIADSYIEQLLEQAKINKENKTIRFYEAEREKYEAEREKYEAGYFKEQSSLIWMSFKFKDLFNRNSSHSIKLSKKHLDESSEYTAKHTVMNITASKENNGCSGYLEDVGEVKKNKRINLLTIASDAAYGGVCFFQRGWFVSTGHNNLLEIKNKDLKYVLDSDFTLYDCLAKMITKIIRLPGINRFMRPIGSDFDREVILLPVIPVEDSEDYIWHTENKKITLATNTMNYLYFQGQINIQQRKIEEYTYLY